MTLSQEWLAASLVDRIWCIGQDLVHVQIDAIKEEAVTLQELQDWQRGEHEEKRDEWK